MQGTLATLTSSLPVGGGGTSKGPQGVCTFSPLDLLQYHSDPMSSHLLPVRPGVGPDTVGRVGVRVDSLVLRQCVREERSIVVKVVAEKSSRFGGVVERLLDRGEFSGDRIPPLGVWMPFRSLSSSDEGKRPLL